MSVKVYFETLDHSFSMQVAEIADEDMYEEAEPFLSELASSQGYVITETVQ